MASGRRVSLRSVGRALASLGLSGASARAEQLWGFRLEIEALRERLAELERVPEADGTAHVLFAGSRSQ
jgi:hypothetical protein